MASTSFLSGSTSAAAIQDDEHRLIASAHAYENSIVQILRNQNLTSKVEHSNGKHAVLVTRLQADTLGVADHSFNFSVKATDVQVTIPVSVTSAHEGAVMVLGVFDNDSAPVRAPDSASLVGPALNIRLLDLATGVKIAGTDQLVEPISFRLMKARPSGARCAFWNESARQWSAVGVQTLSHPSGEFWCSTTHLTLFAGIVGSFGEEAVKMVKCTNVHLLHKEALLNIVRGDWSSSAAAILFWCLLLLQACMLLLSCWLSKVTTAFEDADFLTTDTAYRPRSSNAVRRCYHACSAAFGRCPCCPTKVEKVYLRAEDPEAGFGPDVECAEPKESPRFSELMLDYVAFKCARPILAWQNQIVAGDLGKIGKDDLERLQSRISLSSQKSNWSLSSRSRMSKDLSHGVSKVQIHNAPFLRQVWMIYGQLQPWLMLLQVSVTTGPFVRALLLTSKLLGSLMFSALFFLFEDESLSHQSTGTCSKSKDIQGKVIRNIYLGLVSVVLGTIPLIFLFKLQRRHFVYRESWSTGMGKWYLRSFRFKSFLAILLCTLQCSFSIVYVLSFLANVPASVAHQWFTRAVTILVQEMFAGPFCIAVLYSAVLHIICHMRPQVIDRVQDKLRSPGGTPTSAVSKHSKTLSAADIALSTTPGSCKSKGSWMFDLEAGNSCEISVFNACKKKHEQPTWMSEFVCEPEVEPEVEPEANADPSPDSNVEVSCTIIGSPLCEAADVDPSVDVKNLPFEPLQDTIGTVVTLETFSDVSSLPWSSEPLRGAAFVAKPMSPEA